jgi:hypothetical protein
MAHSESSCWFETLPPEIIVQIFQCCNTTGDVLALASTCRCLHGVWQVNTAAALWPVLVRELPLLPDTLVAVSPISRPYCRLGFAVAADK